MYLRPFGGRTIVVLGEGRGEYFISLYADGGSCADSGTGLSRIKLPEIVHTDNVVNGKTVKKAYGRINYFIWSTGTIQL